MGKIFLFVFSITILVVHTSFRISGKSDTVGNDPGLEGIIVEKYYVSKSKDLVDTLGGGLSKGSVTYRIYVDMKPGYTLQAIYGVPKHQLIIKTTTTFFNNVLSKSPTGDKIMIDQLNNSSVGLDSWLTIGAASQSHMGILKKEDSDGSILMRKSLAKSDGLIKGDVRPLINYGIDLSCFDSGKSISAFTVDNGSLAVLGGAQGPTSENKVLIAQLTTTGKLSFELNLQLGVPTGGVVQYVARNPEGREIQFKDLIYN